MNDLSATYHINPHKKSATVKCINLCDCRSKDMVYESLFAIEISMYKTTSDVGDMTTSRSSKLEGLIMKTDDFPSRLHNGSSSEIGQQQQARYRDRAPVPITEEDVNINQQIFPFTISERSSWFTHQLSSCKPKRPMDGEATNTRENL
eukprot:gene161-1758_t